jgi:hypothetical protein
MPRVHAQTPLTGRRLYALTYLDFEDQELADQMNEGRDEVGNILAMRAATTHDPSKCGLYSACFYRVKGIITYKKAPQMARGL